MGKISPNPLNKPKLKIKKMRNTHNKRDTKKFRKSLNTKQKSIMNKTIKNREMVKEVSDYSLGVNVNDKRAIYLRVNSDGENILQSFFVYDDVIVNELKRHNKKNKVSFQSSFDVLLEDILPQSISFIQNRLNIGLNNPLDVQKHIIGQLMYGVGSLTIANEYWNVWGSSKDMVFNISIEIDSDGFIGINSLKNSPGYSSFICNKGIESKYNEVKDKLNLVSYS